MIVAVACSGEGGGEGEGGGDGDGGGPSGASGGDGGGGDDTSEVAMVEAVVGGDALKAEDECCC